MRNAFRRIGSCVFLGALALTAGPAGAQAWPAKPVRLICPIAAGGASDVVLRLMADRLTQAFGRQFYVDNVLGGMGLIATQTAAHAPPDGYTYYLAGVGVVAADRHMFKTLPYDADRDFVPAAILYDSAAFVIAVHPDVPAKNVTELIALAKAEPGKLSYGSDSVGVTSIPGIWFNKIAGTDILAVRYKSPSQMMQDVVAGRTQVVYTTIALLDPFRRAGKLRMLAVTSSRRFPVWEDVPTVSETLPAFNRIVGIGILITSAGTPADILQRFNREIDVILKQPDVVQRFLSLGYTPSPGGAGTPQSIREFMRGERENWDRMLAGVDMLVQ